MRPIAFALCGIGCLSLALSWWGWSELNSLPPPRPDARILALSRLEEASLKEQLGGPDKGIRHTRIFFNQALGGEPTDVLNLVVGLPPNREDNPALWRALERQCRLEAAQSAARYRNQQAAWRNRIRQGEWLCGGAVLLGVCVVVSSLSLTRFGKGTTFPDLVSLEAALTRKVNHRKRKLRQKEARLVALSAEVGRLSARLARKRKTAALDPMDTGCLTLEAGRLQFYRLVAQERGRSEFWLFAIDVDNLKIVNNRFKSHQVTDAALAEFAARMRSVLRPDLDYVVRGEPGRKFLIFMPVADGWLVQETIVRMVEILEEHLETLRTAGEGLRLKYSGVFLNLSTLPAFETLVEQFAQRDFADFDEQHCIRAVGHFIDQDLLGEIETRITTVKQAGGDQIHDPLGRIFLHAHKKTKGTP